MHILGFIEQFPTVQSCRDHFRMQREHEGVICKHCGSMEHYCSKPNDDGNEGIADFARLYAAEQ